MDRRELAALAGALAEVMSRDAAREFFNEPVDAVALGIPDYLDIVERPMCLGEIADRVRRQLDDAERRERAGDAAARPAAPEPDPVPFGMDADPTTRDAPYPSLVAALEDVRLVWRNCKSYNAHPAMAHLRTECDELADVLRDALARSGVEPPRRFELPPEAHPDAVIDELDIPEAYNVFLPGEDLPYRLLDGFVVCRADDHGAPEAVDREDAEEGADREGTSAAAIEGDIGSDGTLSAPSTSPRLAAFGWVCAPDAKTLEPVDDPPEGVDSPIPPEQRRTRRVAVWLPEVIDWSIDYEEPQSTWIITPRGWYRALAPAPEYVATWRGGAQKKFDLAVRAVNALRTDPLGSYDDVLPKVLHPPPKPGKPRGRPPKDRSGEEASAADGGKVEVEVEAEAEVEAAVEAAGAAPVPTLRTTRSRTRTRTRTPPRSSRRSPLCLLPRPPRRRPTFPRNRVARPRRSVGATADASTPRWSSSRSARSSSASSKPPSRPGTSRRPPANSVVT